MLIYGWQPHIMDLNQKTILIPMIGQLSLKTTIKIFPSKGGILLNFNQDYIGLTETQTFQNGIVLRQERF